MQGTVKCDLVRLDSRDDSRLILRSVTVRVPKMSRAELDVASRMEVEAFVKDRIADGVEAYRARFQELRPLVQALFDATDDLRRIEGEVFRHEGRLHREFIDAARHLASPPVSEDDLETFQTVEPSDFRVVGRAPTTEERASRTAAILMDLLDPFRYPWLSQGRAPRQAERRHAIEWTTGLWAAGRVLTDRRNKATREQQVVVASQLAGAGLREVAKPARITSLDQLDRGAFCSETVVGSAKCDVPVRLQDGRLLAIECKVSNTAVNSVKRLIRETGGKAESWRRQFGETVITAAVLAGVYKVANLVQAQDDFSMLLVFQHDLTRLTDFVHAAV